ncbi:MAG: helix-turn-helix transcriptional regulator [Lachnospiraceae bacterium]|nr:helix-turn-helix transcriptional regulator [Lachnospiraceae bacterium]
MKDYSEEIENCPLASVQKIVHGKWTMVIIYFLSLGTLRFSELKRKLPNVTEANLTKELRALEEYGLVHREVYREVPPRVEYSLTPIGIKFIPVLEALEQWAIEYNAQC